MTIFAEYGNIGPASVPIVLSKLREMGRLKKGSRVALLGIGSGLNCSMAEVEWSAHSGNREPKQGSRN